MAGQKYSLHKKEILYSVVIKFLCGACVGYFFISLYCPTNRLAVGDLVGLSVRHLRLEQLVVDCGCMHLNLI